MDTAMDFPSFGHELWKILKLIMKMVGIRSYYYYIFIWECKVRYAAMQSIGYLWIINTMNCALLCPVVECYKQRKST